MSLNRYFLGQLFSSISKPKSTAIHTMNQFKLLLFIFVLSLGSSCNKDKTPLAEYPGSEYGIKDSIIIGDSVSKNIQFTNCSPHIVVESFGTHEYHDIYFGSSIYPDVRFKVYSTYAYNGTWGVGSTVKIESMKPETQISIDPVFVDSAKVYPMRYSYSDTLFQDSKWLAGEFYISGCGDVPDDGCSGVPCPNMYWGHWFGQSEKYIGVRLNNSTFPRLAWIKISLPSTDVNWGQTLMIEEFGFVP
jgi:hypothetical protein